MAAPATNPGAAIAFYGLYAQLNAARLLEGQQRYAEAAAAFSVAFVPWAQVEEVLAGEEAERGSIRAPTTAGGPRP